MRQCGTNRDARLQRLSRCRIYIHGLSLLARRPTAKAFFKKSDPFSPQFALAFASPPPLGIGAPGGAYLVPRIL